MRIPPVEPHPGAGTTLLRRGTDEVRRRKIPQTVALYVIGAWVLLQVADLAFPGLGVPEMAIRYVWIGIFAGFPLVFVFAWRYQITQNGVMRTRAGRSGVVERPDGAGAVPLSGGDRLVLVLLALVALLIAFPLMGAIAGSRAAPEDALYPRDAIAVLPLQNVTGDPDQEYLAAGIHDALVTTLSTVSALTVKASSSTRVYRNVVQPVRETARQLGAGHVVEGSVFRDRDQVQVNVRLIDAATERNVWSQSYRRPLEDVLTLQNEIARTIVDEIRVELAPEEAARLTRARTVDPEVYEAYLRGMYHLNTYTPEGVRTGLRHLHEAVRLDPDDPLAYAGLALGYSLIGHSAHPPPAAFATAREAAIRALELDPLLPEAHASMAEIRLYHDWDWAGAAASFRRALQLNPNLEASHAHYAWLLQLAGDMEGALSHMRRAQQIAPLTPILSAWLGALHLSVGEPERAIAEARRALEINPAFPWGLYTLGRAYAAQGRHDEAIATFERLATIAPNVGRWGLGLTYALTGREAEGRRVVAELMEDPGQKDLLYGAFIYAALGDEDVAMDGLERAYGERVDWLPWVACQGFDAMVQAALRELEDNPRFLSLLDRLDPPTPASLGETD